MPAKKKTAAKPKEIATHTHAEATRRNIPSAEMQQVIGDDIKAPVSLKYPRSAPRMSPETEERNGDLDPQLIWRGKSTTPLEVQAPPLFIQEKVHPKALIDDLLRQSKVRKKADAIDSGEDTPDLFADFNGLPKDAKSTDFYRHEGHWQNRMILGDCLQVMASLAEREGLRGKVQCFYFDPPYGIKFNSNFQWSTQSRDVKGGKADHISREPEQVKAFRDTWRDGIHSYLTYLRDRLILARDLLTDSGSIFVQIGDENVHRVRALMDEVFGEENFVSTIGFVKTSSQTSEFIPPVYDSILWFGKNRNSTKFRNLTNKKPLKAMVETTYKKIELHSGEIRNLKKSEIDDPESLSNIGSIMCLGDMVSQSGSVATTQPFGWRGQIFRPRSGGWKTNGEGLAKLSKADRLGASSSTLLYKRYFNDFPVTQMDNFWADTQLGGFLKSEQKFYVVQTGLEVVKRCMLMATDPGDLVLDPTCGSGTTAAVAEQWGRRWITIDTSRVTLALARARIMGGRIPITCWRIPGKASSRKRRSPEPPPAPPPSKAISPTASSMSVSPTSPSNPSPTTPRSTSSGKTTKPASNPCASSSTKPSAPTGRSGKYQEI